MKTLSLEAWNGILDPEKGLLRYGWCKNLESLLLSRGDLGDEDGGLRLENTYF